MHYSFLFAFKLVMYAYTNIIYRWNINDEQVRLSTYMSICEMSVHVLTEKWKTAQSQKWFILNWFYILNNIGRVWFSNLTHKLVEKVHESDSRLNSWLEFTIRLNRPTKLHRCFDKNFLIFLKKNTLAIHQNIQLRCTQRNYSIKVQSFM